jgi:hypothetical protein
MEEFPTESACKSHFKTQREQEGVICKKKSVVAGIIIG